MWSKPISDTVTEVAGLVLLLGTLVTANLAPAGDERPLDAIEIGTFLARIEGAWQGQALITPIGPRPYDITFARNAAGEFEGAAEPGDATHIWAFHRNGETLELRFLSTFRGNRQPILMTAADEVDGAVIFSAVRPAFLQVRIRAESQTLMIRVFHGDRLHVEIRLHRR
jgi:hypothetical protein